MNEPASTKALPWKDDRGGKRRTLGRTGSSTKQPLAGTDPLPRVHPDSAKRCTASSYEIRNVLMRRYLGRCTFSSYLTLSPRCRRRWPSVGGVATALNTRRKCT